MNFGARWQDALTCRADRYPLPRMTSADFEKDLQKRRLRDEFWIAVDDTVLDSTMTLPQAMKLREELPESEILLLHPHDAAAPEPLWRLLKPSQPAASQPVSASAGSPETSKQLKVLESRVEFLQNTVDAILNMLAELDSFETLRKSLEERQQFIDKSEEELISRSYELDEKVAELEQRIENDGGN